MRKLFAKLHLWLSLPLGIIISIICLSGAALVFERDITQALQRSLYTVVPPSEDTQPLSPSQLATHIQAQVSDSLHLSSLLLSANPHETAFASFRETGRKQLSVNPYTGEVLGWTQSYPFFQTMRKLHRWLLDPPASKGEKSVGKIIVGITTLVMVFILISGLIIWIPRTRKALKNRLSVSCTKGWRRFWYESHVAIGFYSTLLLLVMALTGLTWSFGWYRTAAYSLFGETPSSTQVRHTDKGKDRSRKDEVKITWKDANASAPQSLKGWFYAFHTGSWGGITTKILYFLAALFGGILPLSGYYLWWKRTRRREKSQIRRD
ncbi:PepSY-associated TM helix domain-containing protein [Bacteroides gallinaceum]|uniref:PepSY-associated TM helix domain-containing protein n=1 Tax=Bacteroides gallinaceum TaxID=1462571 RepID=UPI00195D3DF8|nr:PepSY-associated TM helix domain-containing protein [Bacteroides gallinaceum]MBM6657850.1 PepSY domain-containing protein [Bacteroides gallinaceum]